MLICLMLSQRSLKLSSLIFFFLFCLTWWFPWLCLPVLWPIPSYHLIYFWFLLVYFISVVAFFCFVWFLFIFLHICWNPHSVHLNLWSQTYLQYLNILLKCLVSIFVIIILFSCRLLVYTFFSSFLRFGLMPSFGTYFCLFIFPNSLCCFLCVR